MDKYYVGIYEDSTGKKIKGRWKESVEEVNEEANSSLYKVKLGLTLTSKADISQQVVKDAAKKYEVSISDVLNSLSI